MNIRAKEKSPFVVVCLQECERMNFLLFTIKTTLEELMDGLLGKLNMTDNMEELGNKLFLNQQPPEWIKVAYPSLKNLSDWFLDLIARCEQLDAYQADLTAPKSLWISGLFNPMSFITAIKQVTARKEMQSLDDMVLQTDIINIRNPDEVAEAAEHGAYIHGFYLEGAGWELGRGPEQGYLTDMVLKDLHPILPVMHVTAVTSDKQIKAGRYTCPAYLTSMRGGTFVFDCLLAMESEEFDPKIWILAGVALLMSPE
jgi:dynein heavy chain